MSSEPLRRSTSQVEVTNVSPHGIWLLASGAEMFLSYDDFPWFKDARVTKILNVEEPSPNRFYWPDLDVDLTAEMINQPKRFPLTAK